MYAINSLSLNAIMTTQKKNVEITVAGEKFSLLISSEDEAIIRQAAKYVDQQINERRQHSTIKNTERMAIMVALNAMSDLINLQNNQSHTMTTDAVPYLDAIQAKLEAMSTHAEEVSAKLHHYG